LGHPVPARLCLVLTGNQEAADDLAQETLVKAWQSRSSFIPGTNLKAWLFTILRNQFYSDRRRPAAGVLGPGCG
jgi:RNA polymerase sigma-70 factor (ECF subfamily)